MEEDTGLENNFFVGVLALLGLAASGYWGAYRYLDDLKSLQEHTRSGSQYCSVRPSSLRSHRDRIVSVAECQKS